MSFYVITVKKCALLTLYAVKFTHQVFPKTRHVLRGMLDLGKIFSLC